MKAKYQNAAHHSVLGGGSHENLSLGGQNKTSLAALSSEEQARKEEVAQQASKTATMKLSTGNYGVKAPKTKRRTRRVVNAQSNLESLLVDSEAMPDNVSCRSKKYMCPYNKLGSWFSFQERDMIDPFDELPQELFDLIEFSDDEEDFNFSDLSSLSSETNENTKQPNKSLFFPFLDGMTILNFTKNFNFSYFMMPSHVKEKNRKA